MVAETFHLLLTPPAPLSSSSHSFLLPSLLLLYIFIVSLLIGGRSHGRILLLFLFFFLSLRAIHGFLHSRRDRTLQLHHRTQPLAPLHGRGSSSSSIGNDELYVVDLHDAAPPMIYFDLPPPPQICHSTIARADSEAPSASRSHRHGPPSAPPHAASSALQQPTGHHGLIFWPPPLPSFFTRTAESLKLYISATRSPTQSYGYECAGAYICVCVRTHGVIRISGHGGQSAAATPKKPRAAALRGDRGDGCVRQRELWNLPARWWSGRSEEEVDRSRSSEERRRGGLLRIVRRRRWRRRSHDRATVLEAAYDGGVVGSHHDGYRGIRGWHGEKEKKYKKKKNSAMAPSPRSREKQ